MRTTEGYYTATIVKYISSVQNQMGTIEFFLSTLTWSRLKSLQLESYNNRTTT